MKLIEIQLALIIKNIPFKTIGLLTLIDLKIVY